MAPPDLPIATDAPALVTGATGFVAGWIVKELLAAGVTVHAAVRDPDNPAKVGHLTDMAAQSPGEIKLFKADLLQPGSYAEAMAGCSVVFHTASPFTTTVSDPQTELIDPAVNGTRNVLDEVNRQDSVRRVVLTSSCAAIYTDAADCADAPGGRISEEVWNSTASLDYQPYSLSKTLAERAAWDIAEAQDRWRLVVVNPSLVIGPAIGPNPTSESFNIVRQMADGTMKMGAPRMAFGAVDVRDLAHAHLAAAYLPDAHGRNIVSGHETDLYEMAMLLHDRFGGTCKDLPKRVMPKWLLWLVGPFMANIERRFIARNVGHPWRADTSKAKRDLGATYRPLRDSMEDMFAGIVDSGLISP